jgi:hypothetical protein
MLAKWDPSKPMPELTEYGKAVREYRIAAFVHLGSHATALNTRAAHLSAIEFGKAPLTREILEGTIEFFKEFGIDASGLRNMQATHPQPAQN